MFHRGPINPSGDFVGYFAHFCHLPISDLRLSVFFPVLPLIMSHVCIQVRASIQRYNIPRRFRSIRRVPFVSSS